ncbi:MAG: lipopolysaccharide transport system ATP-binding protein [Pyrinomonadaceae bacterium]|jgi:lipopolysaccharide transport system ATP-binding protein|nr:lipopolysaccharide transport system ATP-binding protein [Pyrinomonadaceae bacterium]
MKPIIQVDRLGKKYRIGTAGPRYGTLRDSLAQTLTAPFRRARATGNGAPASGTIWALKDVSFEVMPGEVVGIIGRNGAGKSTLLKVLSRITEPTTGAVDIYGRVASLLEVGTGFHPELTGRENIFLNGAILGMKRAEIEHKFDEMVAFAEVEKFIDTPVKHFSTGMYLRLAFAVAAHLDPEILVVDEVLAVGDALFQKKCLGKMAEMKSHGRTVLFVSHNMPAVLRLCGRAILLDEGAMVADGLPQHVMRHYLRSPAGSHTERTWDDITNAPGDTVARLHAVRVRDEEGNTIEASDIRRAIYLEVEYWNLRHDLRPTALLIFKNEDGVVLFQTNDFNNRTWLATPREPGLVRAVCQIPGNFLAEGRVFVTVGLGSYNPNVLHALERDAVAFHVYDRSEGDGVRSEYVGEWPGVLRPMLAWEVDLTPGDLGSGTNDSVPQ